jgi:small subunit ribosomal protein S9
MHRLLGRPILSGCIRTAGEINSIIFGGSRITLAAPSSSSMVVDRIRHLSSPSSSSSSPPPNFRLARPEKRRETPDPRRKWRIHAVSLEIGNYVDDDDDDAKFSSPLETEDWKKDERAMASQVQEIQLEKDLKKQRWLENAAPPVRHSIIDERGRSYGRGGRKTAAARVWIQPGFGNIVVNQMDYVDYFDRTTDRELILLPLAATESLGKFDVTAIVKGGGLTGQAGAIRHGLSRALNHYNPDKYRPPLKRLGYLTRDARKVERKKIGHLKARKKPQWVKR